MAAFDNAAYIGSRLVAPTEAQLTQAENADPALYKINLGTLLRHINYFQLHLGIAAAINAATVVGMGHVAKIPYKVVAGSVGVESAAGSAATAKFEKSLAATPTSFTDLVEAAVDVKTAAGTMQDVSITDGKEDFAVGDIVRMSCTGTGAGAVVGAVGTLHAFRL
jgi:hypothetical protein